MNIFNSKKLVKKCLAKIKEEDPAGIDPKFDPVYEELNKEIGKLTFSSGTEIDWDLIAKNSLTLLSEKSKDLSVAGFLCLAFFRIHGYEGLTTGLKIYFEILTNYDYYPKRNNIKKTEKVRYNTIGWLDLRMSEFLKAFEPESKDADNVVNAYNQLLQIQESIKTISTPPPVVSRLARELNKYKEKFAPLVKNKEKLTQKKQSEKKNAQKAINSNQLKEKKISETNFPEKQIDSSPQLLNEEIKKNPSNTIITSAKIMREKDIYNPVSYKIVRTLLWETVSQLPQADKDGITPIPLHIRSQSMDAFYQKYIVAESNPEETINACEKAFFEYGVWWLDLQYAIVHAMKRSESDFSRAIDAIQSDIVRLVNRFPNIHNNSYKDGKKFADDRTKSWIEKMMPAEDSVNSTLVITSSANNDMNNELNNAKEMASKQSIESALSMLQKNVKTSLNKECSFRYRLLAGQLCMNYDRISESQAILEDLFEQSNCIKLEEWNPSLFFELCISLEKGYNQYFENINHNKKDLIKKLLLRTDLNFSLGSCRKGSNSNAAS